jgi:enoyl-CoA hydratase/carnithine racemase
MSGSSTDEPSTDGLSTIYEVRNRVAWLTMNRPEALNALNAELRAGLKTGFDRFVDDEDAAVLVLTGAGDKAFSAGGDLKEMAATELQVPPPDFVPQPGRTMRIDKPVIAAVNGVAYAGGFLLAQTCDLCIAAAHARFAVSEARWGRGSPWAAPLPGLVGPRVAMELMLTARPIDAHRALQVGLVNQVVPAAELAATAQELGEAIAANAPLSVRAAKAMVYATVGRTREEAWQEAEDLFRPAYLSEDALEGPRAFREKRAPAWRGR